MNTMLALLGLLAALGLLPLLVGPLMVKGSLVPLVAPELEPDPEDAPPDLRRWFADDATIFFPIPEPPHRFSGRAEFEAQWTKVFAAIRSGSASKSPPFHRLPVHDFRCDPLGSDAALISFTLDNSERIGRRTLVWHRSAGRWRIVHLHASNTPK